MNSTTEASPTDAAAAYLPDEAAVYLTDGVFLYRCARLVGSGADEAVELEDCYGLDVVKVSVADLSARRLRVVTPAAGEG